MGQKTCCYSNLYVSLLRRRIKLLASRKNFWCTPPYQFVKKAVGNAGERDRGRDRAERGTQLSLVQVEDWNPQFATTMFTADKPQSECVLPSGKFDIALSMFKRNILRDILVLPLGTTLRTQTWLNQHMVTGTATPWYAPRRWAG